MPEHMLPKWDRVAEAVRHFEHDPIELGIWMQ